MRAKRKFLFATLFAVTATITGPLVNPGTASAQTNSRLCGQVWTSVETNEVVTRIYEIAKNGSCNQEEPFSPTFFRTGPFYDRIQDKASPAWEVLKVDDKTICERWYTRDRNIGGLGQRKLVGENIVDEVDICNNMKRGDGYWLYFHGRYNDQENDEQSMVIPFAKGP